MSFKITKLCLAVALKAPATACDQRETTAMADLRSGNLHSYSLPDTDQMDLSKQLLVPSPPTSL